MKGTRVLLVDDEKEFVSALSERLNIRGLETRTAFSGSEALGMIDSDPPEIVILDMMMPGMSGVDVLNWIDSSHPDIKVILLTGNSQALQPETENKASGWLIKPVKIEELLQKMSEALKVSKN